MSIKEYRERKRREAQDAELARAAEQAALIAAIAGEPSDEATRNVIAGELVMGQSCLYEAIRNIPRGAALVEGMNVVRTSMVEHMPDPSDKE